MGNEVLFAFMLTLFAGLATGVGGFIAFFAKRTDRRFLSFSLGFSAGVMLYVSFMELLFEARIELQSIMESEIRGDLIMCIALFGGMGIAALIDVLVPEAENPHELRSIEDIDKDPEKAAKEGRLARMGLVTAFAIALHNFPEGIATFVTAVQDPQLGIAIAVAIAIHNIPEGIAVAVPIFYATNSRKKAFWYSLLSGLAEPLGAIVAYLILMPFLTPTLLYCTFAAVAGIMIYISIDELLPAAREYGFNHTSIYGMILGMLVMAGSLLLLA